MTRRGLAVEPPVLIVHGGAGTVDAETVEARLAACRRAARAGWDVLRDGGNALDAVQAAVVDLEDDPLFNAGTGAVLNRDGRVELDAALMEGHTLRAGAVTAIDDVRNPVVLARRVLDDGRHVMLAGEGARRFARQAGIPAWPSERLVVTRQQQRWQERHGTVGAVARDRAGHLAAATSTGGTFDKLPGRVGDTPLIGCGTYADHAAAVSCTGLGEAIIRLVLAHAVAARVAAGEAPDRVARAEIERLAAQTAGEAGLIVIGPRGEPARAFNSAQMPVAWFDTRGAVHAAA